MYVAASQVAAGFGVGLARRYPEEAAKFRLNGLFARRAVRAGEVLDEYRGERTESRGPYTLELSDGSAIEPGASCAARYANFARTRAKANAEFVERGAKALLVSTRAIAPNEEILTYMAHEPPTWPTWPTRDAKIAYQHLRRADEHRRARNSEKQEKQESRAKQYARRALRAIWSANEAAFGAQTAQKSTGGRVDPDLEAHREATRRWNQAQAQRARRGIPRGIPNLGGTSYLSTALQCLFVTPFEVAEQYADLRRAYAALKIDPDLETVESFLRASHEAFRTSAPQLARAMTNGITWSGSVDIAEFLHALLACAEGCADSAVECPFEYRLAGSPGATMLHLGRAIVPSLNATWGDASLEREPAVLCISVEHTDRVDAVEAQGTLSLAAFTHFPSQDYDLVAVAASYEPEEPDERRHYVACTKLGDVWSNYDGAIVSRAGGLMLASRVHAARVLFYRNRAESPVDTRNYPTRFGAPPGAGVVRPGPKKNPQPPRITKMSRGGSLKKREPSAKKRSAL